MNKESNSKKPKDKIMHSRKMRYQYFLIEVLPALNTQNRDELFQYKLEVKQFIQQIKHELEQN
jgi:hypothetical protein